jgi:CspA family cold shock protein
MALSGKVRWFDQRKGYGFIDASDGGGDVFVHFGDIELEPRALEPDDQVEFEVKQTPYGRRASRVRKIDQA